ncbi:MAG: response regulator [endosymbiont of Escarpia spicata]|uniref:Response regulator n=1 Tax=endosymbiont of Escarpia spicata TaxID=2200908 RepID=A0A370DCA5_9GAMM|nr:MAG: response regulator [endosymbiont of Escarpia spicata]
MNTETKRILIVDDSADDIHFVMESFSKEYAVLAATSGEKALQIADRDPRPDVILMDVEMPGMNGYETCRRLKEAESTQDIDVIFVSSHDTTEEKLAGYDAGGSDYLIKPVQPDMLLQKVKLAISNRADRESSAQETSSAMQTAMTAISNVGEMGVVINFLRGSFLADNSETLARQIVEATANYGLENSVQISSSEKPVYASSNKSIPPLEQELLSRLSGERRIMESGSRLILSFGVVSQLIKNMPDDDDRRGRLRDHLAILLEGAEARAKALAIQTELASVVADSNQTLLNIELLQKKQQQSGMQIMDDVVQDIENAFFTSGLTEEQEKQIMDIVQLGAGKSQVNLEQGLQLNQQLRAIIDRLAQFSSM